MASDLGGGFVCRSRTHRDGTEEHGESCFLLAAREREALAARLAEATALLRAALVEIQVLVPGVLEGRISSWLAAGAQDGKEQTR